MKNTIKWKERTLFFLILEIYNEQTKHLKKRDLSILTIWDVENLPSTEEAA